MKILQGRNNDPGSTSGSGGDRELSSAMEEEIDDCGRFPG